MQRKSTIALRKGAWCEIRSKLLLLCGRDFPADLFQIIFNHALQTEGIPADPAWGVWRYVPSSASSAEELIWEREFVPGGRGECYCHRLWDLYHVAQSRFRGLV
jgi:hypothetical protein